MRTVATSPSATTSLTGRIARLAVASALALGLAAVAPPSAHADVVMPTQTLLSVPNTAQVNQAMTIVATVIPDAGTAQPQGTVAFANANGQQLGTVGLTGVAGTNTSQAALTWTSTSVALVPIIATYSPAPGFAPSQSPRTNVDVVLTAPLVTQRLPVVFNVGVPVTLTALTPWQYTGSVSWLINNKPITASFPANANGVTSYVWTPTINGQATVSVDFSATNGFSQQNSQPIYVNPAPVPDPMSVQLQGVGVLSTGTPATVTFGQKPNVSAASGSGSPVTLLASDPCDVVSGEIVTQSAGTCTMTASSVGGNGFAAQTVTFTINVVPGTQTANLSAPKSGSRIRVGQTVRLATAAQNKTNAGRTIRWRVTKGASTCTLSTSNGVRLTGRAKGSCRVQGTAPAVAGQWKAYSVTYTYRIG